MKLSTRGPKPNTQTAVILAMFLDGFDRVYIAKTLGIRYQNVNKAIKRFGAKQGVHIMTEQGLQLKEQAPFNDEDLDDQQDTIHSEVARRGVCETGDGRTEGMVSQSRKPDEHDLVHPSGEDVEGWISPWLLRNLETRIR